MRKFVFVIVFAFLSPMALADRHGHKGGPSAGPGPGMMKEPTKEERQAMVDMHTKMAECLKTEKPMADCHKEMVDSCPMAKEGQCPMMGMMDRGRGAWGMPKGQAKGMKPGKAAKGSEKTEEATEKAE